MCNRSMPVCACIAARLCSIALLALTMGAMAGCGDNSDVRPDGPSTITYWRTLSGAAGDAQDELVQRFNDTHSTAQVISEFQGSYTDLATKLTAAVVARMGPDVTQLGTFEIRQFARSGQLVDLRSFMLNDPTLETDDWPGALQVAGEVDGGIYWLPLNVSVPVLYYNKDAFAQAGLPGPPDTWEQFYDYARQLTVHEDGRVVQSGVALWNITWPLLSVIWSEGGELTTRDYSNITLNDPTVVSVMGAFQELIRDKAAVMPDQASGGHRALFKSGRAAMILDSPAAFEEIMTQSLGFSPGVAMYPSGKAGRVFAPGGGGIAMLELTPEWKRGDAWTFMKYLLAPEQVAQFAKASGYLAFTADSQQAMGEMSPEARVMHDSLQYLRGDFSVNMSPAVRNAFDKAFQEIMIKLEDVETALTNADADAERTIVKEL